MLPELKFDEEISLYFHAYNPISMYNILVKELLLVLVLLIKNFSAPGLLENLRS